MRVPNKINIVTKSGSTIIELLVVISIIGIFASLSLFGFSQYQAGARDSTRIADLDQIALALSLHRDSAGSYPASGTICQSCNNDVSNLLVNYLSVIPEDIRHGQTEGTQTFQYVYDQIDCGGTGFTAVIVMAEIMERPGNASRSEVDTCANAGSIGTDSSLVKVIEFIRTP